MDITTDGHIITVKELDTDFSIPRKRCADQGEMNVKSILTAEELPAVSRPLTREQLDDMKKHFYDKLEEAKAGEPSPAKILKKVKECAENFFMGEYETYPEELKQQFSNNECYLCKIPLDSETDMKVHYTSIKHKARVTNFLTEYKRNNGQVCNKLVNQHLLNMHPKFGLYRQHIENFYIDNFQEFPMELKQLHSKTECKLCKAKLQCNNTLKAHYSSAKHANKVKNFLADYAKKTGVVIQFSVTTEHKNNPAYFYCKDCDLPLSGEANAKQHYAGKQHQNVITGRAKPHGKGYYDENGQFIRNLGYTEGYQNYDGFGLDFYQPTQPVLVAEIPTTATPLPVVPPVTLPANSLRCEVCNVSVTSIQVLEQHLKGQKHMKRLKAAGVIPPPEVAVAVTPAQPAVNQVNFADHRTPSGQYYCPTCNRTLESEPNFATHLQSKNHLKQVAAKQPVQDSKKK